MHLMELDSRRINSISVFIKYKHIHFLFHAVNKTKNINRR